MIRRKTWYALHRWIGLAVAFQLLAWSVGGFVFSVLDIQDVRGNADRAELSTQHVAANESTTSPYEAIKVAQSQGCGHTFERIVLRARMGETVYELYRDGEAVCTVDAQLGTPADPISKEQAKRLAIQDFAHEATVRAATLITEDAPNEYRGGPLPAYQVILDHPKQPHIYISSVTGEVTKRRNKLWRTFDFFWMLHIMDYRDRTNFNHWLLTGMSALAILTSVSGLVLWWWRIPSRRTEVQ